MKVGVIGAGTMGQGIAKAFAQVKGYTVALCDIKQEWAEGGKNKIAAGYAKLVAKVTDREVVHTSVLTFSEKDIIFCLNISCVYTDCVVIIAVFVSARCFV